MTSAGAGWARWEDVSTTSWAGSSAGGTISGSPPPCPGALSREGDRLWWGRERGLRLALLLLPPAQMSRREVESQLPPAEK